jgi:peptidoglycan L-alanyl-D-glutamate endopeptidase CwlK
MIIEHSERLADVHPDLVRLVHAVAEHWPVFVIEGHRGQAAQDAAFARGASKLKWPKGKHNSFPSRAIDMAPSPLNWDDRERLYYFAGFVQGVATQLGIGIRYGGDWDSDRFTHDNSFDDLVHFELTASTPTHPIA